MDGHTVTIGEIKSNVGAVEIVVRKVFLDDMALVAAADDEVMEAEAGVVFHDVPQNRLIPNLDHGLWLEVTLLADPCAQAAGQNHNLH